MIEENIVNCTRCGAPLTDMKIKVSLYLDVDRLKETGIWEEIPNLSQYSAEILCPDCFDKWVNLQTQMNIPYKEDTQECSTNNCMENNQENEKNKENIKYNTSLILE